MRLLISWLFLILHAAFYLGFMVFLFNCFFGFIPPVTEGYLVVSLIASGLCLVVGGQTGAYTFGGLR